MRNDKIRTMTLDAIFIALIIIVNFIQFGFLQIFPTVSITILHIFVIIIALLGNYKRAAVVGLTFGLVSLLQSYLAPKTIVDQIFQNPFVSVLPRLAFGIISGLIAQSFIKKVRHNNTYLSLYSAIIAGFATLLHTLLTVGCIYIFESKLAIANLGPDYIKIIMIILSTNGLIEIILAVILVPTIVLSLYKYSRRFYEPNYKKLS